MVNGFCMGGGFELALACRYRVALDDPKTRFAFPEVMLGIMPAWHGVQWLPKLVGPVAALDLLLTGKAVDARRAKRMGLVDQAVPLRILENTARMVTLEAPAPKGLGLVQGLLERASQIHRRQPGRKTGRETRPARALPGALRDPRAVAEVRRRSRSSIRPTRRARSTRCSTPDHQEPHPHLLPAGADEGAGQGRRLQGAARARRRRGRDGRRHRRVLRHARHHGDAAGHRARAHRAGDEARRGAVQAAAARQAARCATPWTG